MDQSGVKRDMKHDETTDRFIDKGHPAFSSFDPGTDAGITKNEILAMLNLLNHEQKVERAAAKAVQLRLVNSSSINSRRARHHPRISSIAFMTASQASATGRPTSIGPASAWHPTPKNLSHIRTILPTLSPYLFQCQKSQKSRKN